MNADENSLYEELGRLNNELANMQRETFKKNSEMSRLAAIVESSEEAITSADLDGAFISWNAAAERLYGYSKSEVLGRHAITLSLPGQTDLVPTVLERLRRGEMIEPMEVVYTLPGGFRRDISLTFSPLKDAQCNLTGVSCFGRDITARKQIEAALQKAHADLEEANRQLQALATRDGLTGLSNHRIFQEQLEAEVRRANRLGQPLALVMLDVDNFKQFNDTFGHPAGDGVLKNVASLLQSAVRDIDLAARYGGEEFALILAQTDQNNACAAAERVRASIASASWDKRVITVSIGVCSLSRNVIDAAALIDCADKALYRSKEEGKNRVSVGCHAASPAPSAMMVLKRQTKAHHEAIEHQMKLLLDAVTRRGYVLLLQRLFGYYQPIEAQITALPEWRDSSLDVEGRQKSHLLISDLEHMGVSPEEWNSLPRCKCLPEYNDLTQALGGLYVLEGATLGGQIILRHLRRHLDVDAGRGGSFFASYGANVGPMWRAFSQFVNSRCTQIEAQSLLACSARDTFDTMNCWLFVGNPEIEEIEVR